MHFDYIIIESGEYKNKRLHIELEEIQFIEDTVSCKFMYFVNAWDEKLLHRKIGLTLYNLFVGENMEI